MWSKNHWESIYSGAGSDELSWYQAYPTASLRLIASAALPDDARIIDVGGGDARLVDALLDLGFSRMTVLDISPQALERARARLGERAGLVTWIEDDITSFRPTEKYDLWHDRAVFHFLTDTQDRQSYLRALADATAVDSQIIISTFAPEGPPKCSGLDVARYSGRSLADELGPDFELVEDFQQVHVTPKGAEQAFLHCLFRKRR